MPTIMISCGEPSGDLYAGALASALLKKDPHVRLFGLGGERLRAAGARLIGDYSGLTVTGLVEALRVLPESLRMYRRLLRAAEVERPDVFVAVDFPDFNFKVARALSQRGVPVVYYISPQLWAWRPRRMRTMKRIAARVLVIFPFEEQIYRRAAVPVEFVGHPLVDLARPAEGRETFLRRCGLEPRAPTIALLPGSRTNEVRAILPPLVEAAGLIAGAHPGAQFVVARAPNLGDHLFAAAERKPERAFCQTTKPEGAFRQTTKPERAFRPTSTSGFPIAIVSSRTDDVLAASDLVLTASGTATVQAAIHERPMIIVYRLSPWTYRLGKPFVHVDTYGMVNLVAGARIVPELIQEAFTPESVAREAIGLLSDPARAERTREALRDVRAKLGRPGASDRAADAVLRVARQATM